MLIEYSENICYLPQTVVEYITLAPVVGMPIVWPNLFVSSLPVF